MRTARQREVNAQAKFLAVLLWGGGGTAWLLFFLVRTAMSNSDDRPAASTSELAAIMNASAPVAATQVQPAGFLPARSQQPTGTTPSGASAPGQARLSGMPASPADQSALEAALARRPELHYDRVAADESHSRDREPERATWKDGKFATKARPQLPFKQRRGEMVRQFEASNAANPRVLSAFRSVEREYFVPRDQLKTAYDDREVDLGQGRTMLRPQVLAAMTELAEPQPNARLLNVGSDTGYAAAVFSKLVAKVYAVEDDATLAARARRTLSELGYENVDVRHAEAMQGCSDLEPFDIIVVSIEPKTTPHALLEQLARGGRMVVRSGPENAEVIYVIQRDPDGKLHSKKIPTEELLKIARRQ
ncbi:MAG: protein-L-isoaspartate O-methyltransferase [Planctomycetales bacterium]|nr:protein-L-isoaspartate O-methyltransferase [Planctomycetales bacterium]